MKPIIGVIGRPDMASDDDKVICIWEETRRAIVKKKGIPFLLLPNQDIEYETLRPKDTPKLIDEEKEDLNRIVDMCDGLLIPGGYKWYEFDEYIYNYALEKNIPILGICAGMQMMCRIDQNKNDICEDTTIRNNTKIDHHQRNQKYVHNINIIEDTKLSKIINKKQISVNSKHNYHVNKTINLKVSAYSEDGLIEAVEYDDKDFVIGLQWHPETMLEYDENATKIFDEFMKNCSNIKN